MQLHRLFLITGLLMLLATQAATAQSDDMPLLHRGVNLAGWLANALRQPLYDRDFQHVKQTGFDFVRLPVNPDILGFKLGGGTQQAQMMNFSQLDNALTGITGAGLAVVLDIHPGSSFMKELEGDDSAEDDFVALWTALAQRYKNYPHATLVFELLNEPQYYNRSGRYNRLVERLVKNIRVLDPHRLLIVESPGNNSLYPVDSLKTLNVIPDPNIIYDVHFYQPYIITHQGINSGFEKKQIRFIHGLSYPSDTVDKNAVTVTPDGNPAKASQEIDDYIKEGWNAARIRTYFAPAAEWAKDNHTRLLVLEYGAYRNHITPEARYRWIKDTRASLDSLGIGWALWDFTDIFGIVQMKGETSFDPVDGSVRFVHPETGHRIIEPAAIDALGLTPR